MKEAKRVTSGKPKGLGLKGRQSWRGRGRKARSPADRAGTPGSRPAGGGQSGAGSDWVPSRGRRRSPDVQTPCCSLHGERKTCHVNGTSRSCRLLCYSVFHFECHDCSDSTGEEFSMIECG